MPSPDSSASNVATTALQGIPFSSLIGAPLNAAIEAQAKAAKSTVDFINAVGLTGPEHDRRPIQVEFLYYANGRETKLVVPLLTIVPIPYLAIDELDIRFKANIKAEASTYQEDNSSTEDSSKKEIGGGVGWGPWRAKANFNANYSSKKDSKATQQSKYSVEYTMDVHVHAGQEDMPAGLAKVLGILEQSIAPTQAYTTIHFTKDQIKIDVKNNKNYKLIGTAYDDQGRVLKDTEVKLLKPQLQAGYGEISDPAPVKTDENGEFVLSFDYTKPSALPTQPAEPVNLEVSAGHAKKTIKALISE
ncbi:MAG: DUF2589 domain-containing protein [Nostoc sp. ChiSLP02]|nr:DUF2589 domain-containing protein [Nostoc sp. DedSLP05]MDZ8103227.1 DUF2589 domain-containing protein [Nostoc sp. DedSLP01]MDZ8188022.1 DUF2589 domain-containing protein [Nostoc sp. ChiSLP02]